MQISTFFQGAVGILGSILMICQIFGLFYLSPFLLYFFEISIGSAMMFILSTGAKHRKIAYITAYMLYIVSHFIEKEEISDDGISVYVHILGVLPNIGSNFGDGVPRG